MEISGNVSWPATQIASDAGIAHTVGKSIEQGQADFPALQAYMLKKGEANPSASGRQEFLENLINEFI